jgi:hypothetical protein
MTVRRRGCKSFGCRNAEFLSGAYFVRSFIHPPIPSASMNRPPKRGVASIRPVLENVKRTAVKLSAAARKASQTVSVWVRDG